jgi:ElaB/YqjD/DUF883 family membrane-anchored ribosome-binding protein
MLAFNTLEYAKKLENAGMKQQEAEALAQLNYETISKLLDEKDFVTNQKLSMTELNIRKDMREMELKLEKEIKNLELKITEVQSSLMKYINEASWKIIGVIIGFQVLIFSILHYFPNLPK